MLRDSKFLDKIPEQFVGNQAVETYFEASKRLSFSKEENQKYVEDMMNEWEIQNARDEAVEEARQEGMEQKQTEIARKMLQEGLPLDLVGKITGLSSKEIATLQSK